MSINSHQEQIISDTQRKLLEELLEQLIGMKGVRHAIIAVESRDGSFSWMGPKELHILMEHPWMWIHHFGLPV